MSNNENLSIEASEYQGSNLEKSISVRGLEKAEAVTVMPTKDLVKEHKRLIDTMESPSKEDDKEEIKEQKKELSSYKEKLKKAFADLGIGESGDDLEKGNKKPTMKEGEKPISLTHNKTGKTIQGVWRTMSGNRVFVSSDGGLEISPDHVKEKYSESDKNTGKDFDGKKATKEWQDRDDKARDAFTNEERKEIREQYWKDRDSGKTKDTWETYLEKKADKKLSDSANSKTSSNDKELSDSKISEIASMRDSDADKFNDKILELSPADQKKVMAKLTAKTDQKREEKFKEEIKPSQEANKKEKEKQGKKEEKLQSQLDSKFEKLAKESKTAKEFLDSARGIKVDKEVGDHYYEKFGKNGKISQEQSAKNYMDYVAGKDVVDGAKDKGLSSSSESVKKLSEAAANISMPSTFVSRAINEEKGDLALSKNPELVKYIRDNYGTTDSGAKRSITSALQAFHKDVREKNLSEIKLTPSQQSEVDKYESKIAKENKLRDKVKETNKVLKKYDKDPSKTKQSLKDMGYSDSDISELITPNFSGKRGISSYVGQNASGRIKNYKDQIEQIKRSAKVNQGESGGAMKEGDTGVHGISFENDTNDERVRLNFSGKPKEEARKLLKQGGFKWSPRNKAWQRMNNTNGHAAVKRVLDQLKGMDSIIEKSEESPLQKAYRDLGL